MKRCRPALHADMRRLGSLVLAIALVCTLVSRGMPVSATQAESTAPVSVEVTSPPTDAPLVTEEPVQPEPTEEPPSPPPTEIPLPTSEPTIPPSEIPTEPEPTTVATEAPLPSPTVTSAPSPSPSPTVTVVPSLSYQLGDALNCQPETSTTEIRHGSSIDYRCTLDLSIAADNLPAGTVRVDWQLGAVVGDGWSVQLRTGEAEWTGQSPEVNITHRDEFPTSALDSGEGLTRTVSVGLRISRDRCITDGGAVIVRGGATVSLPGTTGASIQVPSRTTAKVEVAPTLAPIPEPSLAFVGALDLGAVDLDPLMSPTSTSGTITLNVTGLDQSCGVWTVSLNGETLSAESGSTIAAGNLRLVSVNGQPLASGACSLDTGCVAATIESGADAAATVSFQLEIGLDVPIGTTPGSFNSSISASLDKS